MPLFNTPCFDCVYSASLCCNKQPNHCDICKCSPSHLRLVLPEYLLYACSRSRRFFVPNKRSLSSSYATCTGGAYKRPGKLEKEADGLTLTALACALLVRCKSVCSVSRIRASVECCTSAFFLLFFKSTSASCLQNKLCCA